MVDTLRSNSAIGRLISGIEGRLASKPSRKALFKKYVETADQARDRRDWPAAADAYRQAVEADPSKLGIAVQLGHALKEIGDFDAAFEAYHAVLRRTPGDDDLHLQIGHLEKRRGRPEMALGHYRRAVELNPENWDAEREHTALLELISGTDDPRIQTAPPEIAPAGPVRGQARRRRDPAALRRAGDQARDGQRWTQAADAYGNYLELVPDDPGIWAQYGNCLKEAKRLPESEAAYRAGLRLSPDDADLHLQLGHVLKLLDRRDDATAAYRDSFLLNPLRTTLTELRALSALFHLDAVFNEREPDTLATGRTGTIQLEITDLLSVMASQAVVSGIQRVQFGILSYVLSQATSQEVGTQFVVWHESELWALPAPLLKELVKHYKTTGGNDFEAQKRLIARILDHSRLFRPATHDVFVSTGVVYFYRNLVGPRGRLAKSGVRLGAIIYDFIPLSNPEFCAPVLIQDFAPSMSEALLQIDFAITISEFVARETKRLLREAGYPAIPVKAVPLACDVETEGATDEDAVEAWSSSIAELRGVEYVLCVGTLNAHKNHILLLHVWRLLLREGVAMPKLVLVGRRNYGVDDLFHQLHSSRNLDGHVVIIDGPSDAEVATLYRHCLFTMLPSHVEGWGLPVGESLARGKLCVASGTTSIPEVGGDLALYFDPDNASSAADIVRRLLADRAGLAVLEAKVRAEFQHRSWDEYGSDFIAAVTDLTQANAATPGPRLAAGHTLQIRPAPETWLFGTRLPPKEEAAGIVLPRILLAEGWKQPEALGAWMAAKSAKLDIPTEAEAGTQVRIILQMQAARQGGGTLVHVQAGCGAQVTGGTPRDNRRDFLIRIDCVAGKDGRVGLDLTAASSARVRLIGLSWTPHAPEGDVLRPACLLRPTSLAASGHAFPARSDAAIRVALQRRAVLLDHWIEPEAWGTWMAGTAATIAFAAVPGMAACRVVLRVRVAPAAAGLTLLAVSGPSSASAVAAAGTMVLAIDCTPHANGRVEIVLSVAGPIPPTARPPYLGLEGMAYAPAGDAAGRLALAEAVLFAPVPTDDQVEEQLRFTVTGHVNGTYSLANVNRELACALEASHPGHVRLRQVEVNPTRDLSSVPGGQRGAITALTDRLAHQSGLEVSISQHWPVWVPPEPGDLSLALTFWEEGLLPRNMTETLNTGFDAVLAPSRSVAKALIDSGIRVPIKKIGFAPNLSEFAEVGAARAARPAPAVDRAKAAAAVFTFLHVSSCFPRKGVDVLLAAYAQAFGAADHVRLVIKTFPNPHNDVEQQIEKLRAETSDLPPIRVINRDLAPGELRKLYAEADAMVLPTRGEGFNIPAAEAMAAGLALIVTGYGAHLDFADPAFARLIEYRFAPSGSHLASPGSTWVDPDQDDLAAAMRETVERSRSDPAEAARRAALGRAAAAVLADKAAWSERIERAAVELLAKPLLASPKVAWVSSWDVRCGIAEYSRMLLGAYPGAASDVVVLCDDRTASDRPATAHLPQARVAWRLADAPSMDRLADEIEALAPGMVVIQHHKGLIRWTDLITLLQDRRISSRPVILVLHNVQEFLPSDHPGHAALVAALGIAARVLVHTVADLNILKSRGLVGNVAVFPHGVQLSTFKPRPPQTLTRESRPIIGTYGFMLPHKGFALLIQAFVQLRNEWPNARLRMVTAEYPISFSAETLADCRDLARSLGVDHAIEWHTDYLPADTSLALLNACDIVVLPYRETPESSSAAVRTALTSGPPVMVTPVAIFQDVGNAVLRLHGSDVSSIVHGVNWMLHNESARADVQRQSALWQQANDWTILSGRLHDMAIALSAEAESGQVP